MWFSIKKDKLILQVFAKPNAKKSAYIEIKNDAIHISLHAKPQQGEANKELIRFLSEWLSIAKSHIEIVKGESSKYKTVVITYDERIIKFIKAVNKEK